MFLQLAAAALALLVSQHALAFWYPLAHDPETGSLARIPECADRALAGAVIGRFNQTESMYSNGRHTMTAIAGMRQTDFHPMRDDKVARRWCQGTALFADGARRRLVLELGSNTGHLGLTYGLTYCVDGLDRLMAHAPNCRVLRHREF
jgi:hypothetical protein